MIDFREAPFDPNEPITWIEDEKATGKESRLWIHCRNAEIGEWHFQRTLDGYCFTCAYSEAANKYWEQRKKDDFNE